MKKAKKTTVLSKLSKSLSKEQEALKKIQTSLKKTYEEGAQAPDFLEELNDTEVRKKVARPLDESEL